MAAYVFRPLGMRSTTFDFARAQRGNCARPHGPDVDGKMALGKMDLNYAVVPVRPAGGVWTSAHDLSQYVMMELRAGKLPDGDQLVSEQNLRARQAPQILLGEDQTYGMGLIEDRTWGVTVVHHGGDLAGYHSDMIWLPDHGIGAVILTNADEGWRLRRPFLRRLLEVVFDGRPEAEGDLSSSARTMKETIAKERERLTVMAGVKQQELTLVQAAGLMGVGYRQSKRIWRRYQDAGDAGLVHVGVRYYDPQLGRFATRDVIRGTEPGMPQGMKLIQFVAAKGN